MDSRLDTGFFPILVTGVIGAGKSTLINYLLSKTMVVRMKDDRWVIDVADGKSEPVISHSLFHAQGDSVSGQFKDDVKKNLYYETPGIYDLDNHEGISYKALKITAAQVTKRNGAIIFVLTDVCFNMHALFGSLNILKEEIASCPTLFVTLRTKRNTPSQLVNDAKIILDRYKELAPISEKMLDPNNWVCVGLMSAMSRNVIHKWIEKLTPQNELPVGPDEGELSCVQPHLSSTASIARFTAYRALDEFKAVPALKNKANTYSELTQKYINDLALNPNNLDVLKNVSLAELPDCRDSLTNKIARIPVFLDNRLYDLQTLLDLPEHNGFRKIPKSHKDFCLHDIQPAEAAQLKIQEKIKEKMWELAQEEKYSGQARVFTASAERARQQQRIKCVVS